MTDPAAEAVHVHVHLAMAGAFPLRVADLLFTDDRLLVPEYALLTPLFGIARGRKSEVARSARQRYDAAGVAGLIESAERTHRIPYVDIARVRVYDGSGFGRPKIAVDNATGPAYAYRVHAPVDVPALASALDALGTRRGFEVTSSRAVGFSPVASLRRFLTDR